MSNKHPRSSELAVLIDAENTSPSVAAELFQKVAAIGQVKVCRMYGDFSGTRLRSWTQAVATHAIVPHHAFSNTAGKNSSDILLVIDAVDLLHTGRFGGFCLVSSDSDFTRLAIRIREDGLDVYGFGRRCTPESFRCACTRFIEIGDKASAQTQIAPSVRSGTKHAPSVPKNESTRVPTDAVPLIMTLLADLESRDQWFKLADVGMKLKAISADLRPRYFGFSKLLSLIVGTQAFDVRREGLAVYIKPHPGSSSLLRDV